MASQKDSSTTASICAGFWRSKVKGVREGHFDLRDNGPGKFAGDFIPNSGNPKAIKDGTCHGGTRHITIIREDDTNRYVYNGDITEIEPGKFQADGNVVTTPRGRNAGGKGDPPDSAGRPDGDDEWVATRPPA